MLRKCQECEANELEIGIFGFSDTWMCRSCKCQFELTSLQKSLLITLASIIVPVSVYAGILSQSWVVFGFLILGVPVAADVFVKRKCHLKLTGLKAAIRAEGK